MAAVCLPIRYPNVCRLPPEPVLSGLAALGRHTLVWALPGNRNAILDSAVGDSARLAIDDWISANRPFIVTRQCELPSKPIVKPIVKSIAVGLPLPPAQGKRRIGLQLPANAIAKTACLPRLTDVVDSAPANWRLSLRQLATTSVDLHVDFHVFGSLAWQALTGLAYVTAQSDIDLLWRPATHEQLRAGISLLENWELETGLRADGEIVFGNLGAVAWREWSALRNRDGGYVLLKHEHGAGLRSGREVLAQLAARDTSAGLRMALP